MMWWGYDHMSGWGYLIMGLSTVLFWGLVITAIVMAARYVSRNARAGAPPQQSPEDVLAQRFARGEIDAEEYRSRLETLHGRQGHDAY
ncbi:SHOCT domain-containing protein [Actinomadura sp. ATCC 31491]|uniref:SHOCT domain-containing protein n=1 Tax=Actinomadura luzonensis TaxID=2805427 RepID=A0ABT0G911_9ACTN|nr:SHOCT domain-containing protein [Actinomadura luzonensis]MCK2220979.1 SHOCT domain-containing protein [Actinomadura luzonensis]